MKIAAIQMVSTPRVAENLDVAARLVAEAADAGAALVVLPEYFCVMGAGDRDKLAVAEAPGDGPIQRALAALAQRHRLWLVGGTVPLRCDDEAARVRNTSLVFDPSGAAVGRYDKIHLFRFDDGRERYDESAAIAAGAQPTVVAIDGLRVGLSICYDLRFPELYRALSAEAAGGACDLLCVPAAFTHTTGLAHWELLLRARAVENQCYVVAAAQGGLHENGRRTFGHSLIVDPWGEVVAQQPSGEGVVVAELDRERIRAVRRQLPALAHRVL